MVNMVRGSGGGGAPVKVRSSTQHSKDVAFPLHEPDNQGETGAVTWPNLICMPTEALTAVGPASVRVE